MDDIYKIEIQKIILEKRRTKKLFARRPCSILGLITVSLLVYTWNSSRIMLILDSSNLEMDSCFRSLPSQTSVLKIVICQWKEITWECKRKPLPKVSFPVSAVYPRSFLPLIIKLQIMADPTIQTFCCHHANGTDMAVTIMQEFDTNAYNAVCIFSSLLGMLGAIYQVSEFPYNPLYSKAKEYKNVDDGFRILPSQPNLWDFKYLFAGTCCWTYCENVSSVMTQF